METINKGILMLLTIFLVACGKDDGPVPIEKSDEKQISSFAFRAADNTPLDADVIAAIDQSTTSITATVPNGTDITGLKAHVTVSPKATVSPEGAKDFSDPVTFMVSAEDNTTAAYLTTVVVQPDTSNKSPDTFGLLQVANDSSDVDPTPSLSWEPAIDPDGDAITYDLYLDRNPNPSTLITENLSDTVFELPNTRALSLARDYQWKVVAKDGKGGETASEVFTFKVKNLDDATQQTVSEIFSGRERHASAVFQDQMWVLGGFTNGVASNQPWGSHDGADWRAPIVNFEERFTPRYFHAAASFKDKMWVTGGVAQGEFENDVWKTTNGGNWDSIAQAQPFSERSEHTLTSHNGQMWIIGGNSSSGKLADVWSSSDGANWEQTLEVAPFGKRNFHQTVSFDGKLWVIAGSDENGDFKNDVWSSEDGIQWQSATENAQFSARAFHKTLVFDDKIWVIGGGTENDIWYSEDGVDWIDATPTTSFPLKGGFTALFFDSKIWILGGSATNEVWNISYHEFVN